MTKQSSKDVIDIESIIRILEDKRTEVMENQQAGYFIQEWQELGKVSRMIIEDPKYQAIEASQIARFGLRAHRPDPDSKNPQESGKCFLNVKKRNLKTEPQEGLLHRR